MWRRLLALLIGVLVASLALQQVARATVIDFQRLQRDAADLERAFRRSNIERYSVDPRTGLVNEHMEYVLTYWQDAMRWQDGPCKGQFIPPCGLHYRIGEVLTKSIRGKDLKHIEMIEAFRGSAKSTTCVVTGAPKAIAEGRQNVLIFAATQLELTSRFQAITQQINGNPELLERYPLLTPAKDDKGQWVSYTDSQIVFANGARLKGYTFLAKLRGVLWNNARPDFAEFDDVETLQMLLSEVEMRKAKRWFRRDFLPAMSAYAAILYLYTPQTPNCLAYWLAQELGVTPLKQEFYDAHCHGCGLVREEEQMLSDPPAPCSACGRDCDPHWPEFWPPERIANERTLLGPYGWAQEMRLRPMPDEAQVFTEKDFDENQYDAKLLSGIETANTELNGRPLRKAAAWDSAISLSPDADRTAIVTVGMDREGCLYVLKVRVGRWDTERQVRELVENQAEVRPRVIAFQKSLLEKAISQQVLRDHNLPLTPRVINNRKDDKMWRIKGLPVLIRNGKLKFNLKDPGQLELRKEGLNYGPDQHDDILDALEQACAELLEGGSGASAGETVGESEAQEVTRGW